MTNGQCSLRGCRQPGTECWAGYPHACVQVCPDHIYAEGEVGYDPPEGD